MTETTRQPSQFVGTGQGFGSSPQPFIVGHIPPVRLKNQTIQKTMDPPACVQNAMMTKDKKPFTYTPGGIDLSEARSPRLQRRIERNAHLGGVGDVPQHAAPHPPITGPLPPLVLASMRPQPQVQVFPSGPAQTVPIRGGAPPPPPPPQHGIPPPPPPPSCPLPTQKVQTADNQVLERPDMTKIIPDNPMALLRKTGGPQPRKSLVDQIFEEGRMSAPEPKSPPPQAQQFQPPPQRIQPGGTPISPVPQQTYRPPQQQPQQYQPQAQPQYKPQAPVQQNVPTREQYSQPSYSEPVKELPRYQPPVIERQPISPQSNGQQDVKTSTAHLGSLYIPPANQQQQKRIVSPPTPPERNLDSPSVQTPPLREAPRPWQTKKPQEEVPAWAKRDNQVPNNVEEARKVSPPVAQPQQRWPQAQPKVNEPPSYSQQQQYEEPKYNQQYSQQPSVNRQDVNQHQQPIGIRIDIRTKPQSPYHDQPEVGIGPNVVYVTQPMVLQHPGPGSQRQLNNQGPSTQGGPRVIPVQIEGAASGGNDRVLNRQQSWGSNPIQSNSFKVLQKFTNTDGEEEFAHVPITEHSPKYTQNFQQPVDQMRRMKINDGEQNITNTFKQVSRGPQTLQPKGPQVRTIPIQIEGDDPPRPYVHPSEQVVPEPKKYTGSSIPSRSFKILQAMTAPNDYANVEEQNEENPYDEWVYPPHYPPYPYTPYWYDYYHYYYPDSYPEETPTKRTTPRSSVSRSASPATSGRHTPLPFWGYAPPYYPSAKSNDSGKDNPQSIPPPWYGYDSYYPSEQECSDTADENSVSQEYLPYYDPYYYHYYYGYPPIYPPYPARYANSETDSTMNGYSSMDEKGPALRKLQENQLKKVIPESLTMEKRIPTLAINEIVTVNKVTEENTESTTDCETDTETDDEYSNHLQINPLQSMKSITNINDIIVYSSDEEASKEDVQVEEFSEDSNDDIDDASSMCYEEDAYPHQLSIIMEESERAESRLRTVSVLSDSTTLAERSDAEEDIIDDNRNIESKTIDICEATDEKYKYIDATSEEICVNDNTPEENNVEAPHEEDDKNSDDSEDWWGIIGKDDDDDLPKPKKIQTFAYTETIDEEHSYDSNPVKETDTVTEDDETLETSGEESDDVKTNVSYSNQTNNFDNIGMDSSDTIKIHILDNNKIDISDTKRTSISLNSEEKCNETDTSTNDINYTEYKVIRRVKPKTTDSISDKTETKEVKPRPRSIYDSLEDIKSESTGSLIKVDNFVGILEQIQKDSGFWDLNSKLNNEKETEPIIKFRRTKSVEEKSTEEIEKRFTWTSFENFNKETCNICSDESEVDHKAKRFSCGSLEDFKINIQTKEMVNGSTNYIKYNSSLSSTPVFENTSNNSNVPIVAEDNNYDTKSSTNGSQTEESCDTSDSSSSSSSSSEKDDKENSVQLTDESDVKIPTIKDRIQALRKSINSRRQNIDEDPKSIVKDKISVNDATSRSKTASSKSSLKSFEEFSEEEVDSGVTSDMSRHISDTEEFPELKKLTKYQRAATHSRLFKLLQEECNGDDSVDAEPDQPLQRRNLSLRLDETGDTQTQVNERLVNELVDSLLKLKKGQAFKNLPKEKLYAAAVKILQEDMEIAETPSEEFSSFLSPIRSSTGYSTAVQTPQEFGSNYDDYKQYYESWNRNEEHYDIFPSKAFKVLQEISSFNKQGAGLGSLIKCPKVLSSKNIHNKLIRLLESSENSSNPIPDKPPLDTNEVTSAS